MALARALERAGHRLAARVAPPLAAAAPPPPPPRGGADRRAHSHAAAAPSGRPAAAGGGTVSAAEAAKFAALGAHWWDPAGPFRALHQLNPTRVAFIRAALCDLLALDAAAPAPLAGVRLLDVGCGGGLLAEALARLGAEVDGIDVSEEGPAAAAAHAALDPGLAGRLRYRVARVEDEAAAGARYDAVVASEVVEHVASVSAFCAAAAACARPGGALVLSTLARSPRAYALAVVAAERVLGWAPPGTHEWRKFVDPEELVLAVEAGGGAALRLAAGMTFDPLADRWRLSRDLGINYLMAFQRSGGDVEAGGEGDEPGGGGAAA
jgi:2-polyprenyl-6-hydroxyphenyl methylase/3-demethylubiquinone-9 3-methyltransferase